MQEPPLCIQWNAHNPLWTSKWSLKHIKLKTMIELAEGQLILRHIKISFAEWNSLVFVIQRSRQMTVVN